MSRYRFSKHSNLGPVHGFTINTPDNRNLKDLHPQFIVRELNRLQDRIKRLEEAGDALYENSDPTRWDSLQAANRKLDQQEEWRKAKEAKP